MQTPYRCSKCQAPAFVWTRQTKWTCRKHDRDVVIATIMEKVRELTVREQGALEAVAFGSVPA